MGDPVVNPLQIPLSISGWSDSCLFVVPSRPLLRRDRSAVKSSVLTGIPGGQPSITIPMEFPWDSPKMVTLNKIPNEFICKRVYYPYFPTCKNQVAHLY